MADGGIQPYKGRDADAVINQALKLYEEEGLEITEIAPQLNVPARTIHRWLATNAQDRWKETQQARALADYELVRKRRYEAAKALEDLKQTLDEEEITEPAERNWRLTHAREVLRAADVQLDHQKWLLERLLARLYGQKQQVEMTVTHDWGDRLRRAKERVIESEPLDVVVTSESSPTSSAE